MQSLLQFFFTKAEFYLVGHFLSYLRYIFIYVTNISIHITPCVEILYFKELNHLHKCPNVYVTASIYLYFLLMILIFETRIKGFYWNNCYQIIHVLVNYTSMRVEGNRSWYRQCLKAYCSDHKWYELRHFCPICLLLHNPIFLSPEIHSTSLYVAVCTLVLSKYCTEKRHVK